ncbi:MAG TPA: hypothetical protein VGN25_03545 [Solirubrobacteraceae bacterium]|nr:hypothetical protein [Solirubrobacteraceae bacterium]
MAVSACESTEQESAKIAREGAAGSSALKLGAANHDVRVSDATLLSSGGRMAVAVKLTSTTGRTQANLPVLVNVTGAGGKVLYSNEAGGLEASLQHMPLLRAHQSAWWVDDQVLTSQHTTGVKVKVGTGSSAPTASPGLTTTAVHTRTQGGVSTVTGRLVNGSGKAQSQVPVFAVALEGTRAVAAGSVVVASVAPKASASFQLFLIGNASGARLQLDAVATGGAR